MSEGIDKTRLVLQSIESVSGIYSVDIFIRPDGSFGFEEFRKDPEDMGEWTRIHNYSVLTFISKSDALKEAKIRVSWLDEETKK